MGIEQVIELFVSRLVPPEPEASDEDDLLAEDDKENIIETPFGVYIPTNPI